MINRIIFSLFFICLIIAIFLLGFGITHVDIGTDFYAFMAGVSVRMNDFKIDIPNIPQIDAGSVQSGGINALVNIGNFFINFLNVIITIINLVNKVTEFFIIIIVQFVEMLINVKDSYIDLVQVY